jgi:ATP/maltotriose-dependent transcriptional regulator MalT
MISWQVGDLAMAREFAREAHPLLQEDPRIARVVLLIAMAGVALAADDVEDAIRLATAADTVGTELGVERELPLARCVLARSLLAAGDTTGASQSVASAFSAAESMSTDSPFALCLETAALVGRALGADEPELATVLASAAVIRERGSRPAPLTMQDAVADLRAVLPSAQPVAARHAAKRAAEMLSRRVRA